jgi:hypothetical protein
MWVEISDIWNKSTAFVFLELPSTVIPSRSEENNMAAISV